MLIRHANSTTDGMKKTDSQEMQQHEPSKVDLITSAELSSVEQVLATVELLELVFSFVDMRTLLFATGVSKTFQRTIESSLQCQQQLYLQPRTSKDGATSEPITVNPLLASRSAYFPGYRTDGTGWCDLVLRHRLMELPLRSYESTLESCAFKASHSPGIWREMLLVQPSVPVGIDLAWDRGDRGMTHRHHTVLPRATVGYKRVPANYRLKDLFDDWKPSLVYAGIREVILDAAARSQEHARFFTEADHKAWIEGLIKQPDLTPGQREHLQHVETVYGAADNLRRIEKRRKALGLVADAGS